MSGWKFRLKERDGELVPTVGYENEDDPIYDTREQYEIDRVDAAERAGSMKGISFG